MKRYIIGFKDGINRLGSNNTILTHYTAMYKLRELKYTLIQAGNNEVYLINDYTQKMSEMSNLELYDHVKKIGMRL